MLFTCAFEVYLLHLYLIFFFYRDRFAVIETGDNDREVQERQEQPTCAHINNSSVLVVGVYCFPGASVLDINMQC